MNGLRFNTALLFALALVGGCSTTTSKPVASAPGPIAIHGNKTTYEIAPVLLAAERYYPGGAHVRMGGIANIVGEPPIPGFGEAGAADVATHAETQALRYSVRHPDVRIVMTITEGLYRLVARRSAGINSLADLKGKRIATIPPTSAGYFVNRMLASAGLKDGDVEIIMMPIGEMAKALAERRVDAVAIWEPESERALQVLGADGIEFSGKGIYRELFNLNTTAAALANPEQRRKVVAMVRAIRQGAAEIRRDPSAAQVLVARENGLTTTEVARGWPHHAFIADLPADLLDVLEGEEIWLAVQEKRAPRSRAELAPLIDASVLAEARQMER